MKRTRLRSVSPKRAKALKEYRELRDEFMQERRACEAGQILKRVGHYRCATYSQDVHHIRGRGPHLNDTDSWCAVCRPCHDFIHANGGKARSVGLILPP